MALLVQESSSRVTSGSSQENRTVSLRGKVLAGSHGGAVSLDGSPRPWSPIGRNIAAPIGWGKPQPYWLKQDPEDSSVRAAQSAGRQEAVQAVARSRCGGRCLRAAMTARLGFFFFFSFVMQGSQRTS